MREEIQKQDGSNVNGLVCKLENREKKHVSTAICLRRRLKGTQVAAYGDEGER